MPENSETKCSYLSGILTQEDFDIYFNAASLEVQKKLILPNDNLAEEQIELCNKEEEAKRAAAYNASSSSLFTKYQQRMSNLLTQQ